jgi:succinate dehydrogenase/fumarate reductase flavoprotein subunit
MFHPSGEEGNWSLLISWIHFYNLDDAQFKMEKAVNIIEGLGTVISTDVLVLGAGGAGMCAALKASESRAEVLVLDKCGIGWAGQIPIGGGIVAYVSPQQAGEWCRQVTRDSYSFNNQDWTQAFAGDIHQSTLALAAMGVPFLRDKKGEIALISWEKGTSMTLFDAPGSLIALKKTARARGITMLDKVYAIDLLQRNGQVIGAVGLGLVDGETYIFNAKAVIIATGGCGFLHEKTYSFCLGEGPAMGYRAGAQLINCEFGSSYVYGARVLGKQLEGIHYYLYLENAGGEKIMAKYNPELMTGRHTVFTHDHRVIDAMIQEVEAGRGPIYLNLKNLKAEEYKDIEEDRMEGLTHLSGNDNLAILKYKAGLDPTQDKIEMQPMYLHGGGGLRVGLNCQTTLAGLWAAGSAASTGWSGGGKHPGGVGIASAMVTGFRAGESAGEYAMSHRRREIDVPSARNVIERIVAPLHRKGDIDASEVTYQVHEAVVPVKYSLKREAGRMREALGIVQKAKEKLAGVGAVDNHDLARCHQAESMAMAAEFTFKAALMREESRAGHHREDFPSRDDKNWFKWITIEQKGGAPNLSTIPVPVRGG